MAITGTGTEQDPYVVTTYDELVAKAAESGKYVKIGNDINVLAEYPNGDVPTLVVNGYVDGDNKTISRIYNTENKHCISFNNSADSYIENTKFTNISTTYSLIDNSTSAQYHVTLRNCAFAGLMRDGYILNRTGSYCGSVSGCSFNISGSDLHLVNDNYDNVYENCNIKVETSASWLCYNNARNRTATFDGCYLEISAPDLARFGDESSTYARFNNSVLDITTANAVGIDGNNSSVSIFNSTHAPNIATTGNTKGVSDEKWLDVAYLQSIGFNIVEVQE